MQRDELIIYLIDKWESLLPIVSCAVSNKLLAMLEKKGICPIQKRL